MVKVLLFHLFESQRVVAIDEEPLEIVSTGSSFLAATRNGSIHHYSAGAECVLMNHFHTANSSILGLQYSPATDSIATLEKDSEQSAINVVRVYKNWRYFGVSASGSLDATSPPNSLDSNTAALSPANQHASTIPCFKLPASASITCFTACPVTGRIASATKAGVTIYAQISADDSSVVMDKVLELDVPNVTRLALYEDFLAFSTEREVKVLSLTISQTVTSSPTAATSPRLPTDPGLADDEVAVNTGPSLPVNDESVIDLQFDAFGNFASKFQIASLTATASADKDELRSFESLGPVNDSDHRANVNIEGGYTLQSSILLLHRRFMPDERIHTLSLLPEYPQLFDEEEAERLLRSSFPGGPESKSFSSTPLHGMRALVSTTRQAFVYNLIQPALLVTYNFTAETLQCCASSCLLYALTSVGLETWTLRTSSDAPYSNPYPPCLIGMQPFISLQRIVVVGDSVLLLSKIKGTTVPSQLASSPVPPRSSSISVPPTAPVHTNYRRPSTIADQSMTHSLGAPAAAAAGIRPGDAWSLYVLRLTALPMLYNEIITTAASYEDSNPGVYFQLVLEGHFLLKSKLALPQSNTALSAPVDAAVALNMNVEARNYRALLKRSSTLLGNYDFKRGQFEDAARHYASSERPVAEVIRMFFGSPKAHNSLSMYVDQVLFDPKMIDSLDDVDAGLADEILTHYSKEAPHRLSAIILDSSLHVYSQKLALQLLMQTKPDKPKDLFACALLCLDLGKVDLAFDQFKAIDPQELVELCVKNPKLLAFDVEPDPEHASPGTSADGTQKDNESAVPPMGRLLRVCAPWALLEILIQLKAEVALEVSVAMLQRATSYSLYHHPDRDLDGLLLKCFYEQAVLGHLEKTGHFTQEQIDVIVGRLVDLYIHDITNHKGDDAKIISAMNQENDENDGTKLSNTLRKSTAEFSLAQRWRRLHRKAFYKRSTWLDLVPPFTDGTKTHAKNPYRMEEEEFDYQFMYVKKCQGLICCLQERDQTIPAAAIDTILKAAAAAEADSPDLLYGLNLMCLPLAGKLSTGIALLLSRAPQVSFEFGLQFCKLPEHWSLLLDALLEKSGRVPPEVYKQILDYLTSCYDPDAFLHLLDGRGNLSYFLPYIEKVFSWHRAKNLKQNISQFLLDLETQSMTA